MTPEEKLAADQETLTAALAAIDEARNREAGERPLWAVGHRRFPGLYKFWTEAVARDFAGRLPGLRLFRLTADGWTLVEETPTTGL
jgi:hypothetical protein